MTPVPFEAKAIFGCVTMGLAATLGSQFWHDLGKGLVDVRQRVTSVTAEAKAKIAAAKAPRVIEGGTAGGG